jgi:CheY-like chemotaxis protein
MKKVLIIDDDEAVLDVMKEALEYADFEVNIADGNDNIFDLLNRHHPDLLLIDFMLNGANGGEICHLVKTSPQTCSLPVIIISAYSHVFLSLGNYGCDGIINKPFDLSQLIGDVTKYLHCHAGSN